MVDEVAGALLREALLPAAGQVGADHVSRVDGLPGARVQPGGAAGQVVDEEDAAVPADAVGPVLR